ncbi:GNAT family N-acetyltransferase [bacterium]|nr:MAG: GNAT family N-acetyltransferase [bacterium]
MRAESESSQGHRDTVRKVTAGDRGPLVSIISRCANLTNDEKACATELLDIYIKDPLQKDYEFKASVDDAGVVTGYICYGRRPLTEAGFDIYWIVVDPQRRRSGAGGQLLAIAETAMRKQGAKLIIAETSGTAAYTAARGFYLKSGFNEEARVKDFYKPGDDLVMYIKRF